MNPNETQGPGQPQHNETPYAAPAYTQPQQQAAPQAPYVPPQQTAAAARKGANLAESLGSQHIQIGNKKIDYAAIVTLVGAVISIIALFRCPSLLLRSSAAIIRLISSSDRTVGRCLDLRGPSSSSEGSWSI